MSEIKCKKPLGLAFLVSLLIASGSASAQNLKDSIESFSIWHDATLEPQGLVRAEIAAERLDEDPILVINGEEVRFNDSGNNGDSRAGDGIYSALIPLNLGNLFSEQFLQGGKIPVEQIVRELVNAPMFKGRAVARDDAQIRHLLRLQEDRNLVERVRILNELSPRIKDMTIGQLVERLRIDSRVTPLVKVQPRSDLTSLVSVVDVPIEAFTPILPNQILASNSLMITDVRVLEDPTRTFDICKPVASRGNPKGVWTFGYIMRQLSVGSGLTPELFATEWLKKWLTTQTVNQFPISARTANYNNIMSAWQTASLSSPTRRLDVDYFPARLMAIVNRPDIGFDLRGNAGGYGTAVGIKRGEARFVFALLNVNGTRGNYPIPSRCSTLPHTVIFEYNTPTNSCQSVKSWQTRWRNLSSLALGSSSYNTALANITTSFTSPTNMTETPNRSWLAQLRTNENAFVQPWELREFILDDRGTTFDDRSGATWSNSGRLLPTTVKATPKERPFSSTSISTLNGSTFNNTRFLSTFALTVWPFLQTVPLTMPNINPWAALRPPAIPVTSLGIHFRSGSSFVRDNALNYHWNYPGSNSNAQTKVDRRMFSLATCNGCHTGETWTNFTHIGEPNNMRSIGQEAKISRFLTGKNTVATLNPYSFSDLFNSIDPSGNGVTLQFNDIAQRRSAMQNVLATSCGFRGHVPLELLPSSTFDMIH